MTLSKAIIVLLLAVIISLCSAEISERLVNSHWANSEQFPYHVAIVSRSPQTGRISICSGASIHPRWVLTSAACVLQSSQWEVRTSSVNFYTGGISEVSRIAHAHPMYDPVTQLNNFGLVQATTSTSNRIQILPLNSNLVLPRRQSIVTGWGLTGNNENSPVLQFAYGTILNSEERNCKYNFNNATVNNNLRLCATFTGQRTCAGDTGSPLVIQANRTNFLVGVASFDAQTGRCASSTSLFATFSPSVRDWITEITGTRP